MDIALAGGVFIDTEADWQQLQEAGWQVVEDAGSHAPVLVSPEAAQMIEREFDGNFGASPWAQIFDETRGSTLEGKFKTRSDAPAVAAFDSRGNPILVVSLAEFNPLGEGKVAVILTDTGELREVPWAYRQKWHFRDMIGRWDPVAGKLVLVDEYETATHEWDDQKREWVELEKYRVYGTPEERVAYALDYKTNKEVRRVDSTDNKNLLRLDEEMVKETIKRLKAGESVAKINAWLETAQPSEPDKARIYILTSHDEAGREVPAMVAVVGGEYGLDAKHFQAVVKAARRLEEIDPGILQFLAEQFGLKFISEGSSFMVFNDGTARMSSNDGHDTMFVNKDVNFDIKKMMAGLFLEGGELSASNFMDEKGHLVGPYKGQGNFGLVAANLFEKWITDPNINIQLTQDELYYFISKVTQMREAYSPEK